MAYCIPKYTTPERAYSHLIRVCGAHLRTQRSVVICCHKTPFTALHHHPYTHLLIRRFFSTAQNVIFRAPCRALFRSTLHALCHVTTTCKLVATHAVRRSSFVCVPCPVAPLSGVQPSIHHGPVLWHIHTEITRAWLPIDSAVFLWYILAPLHRVVVATCVCAFVRFDGDLRRGAVNTSSQATCAELTGYDTGER